MLFKIKSNPMHPLSGAEGMHRSKLCIPPYEPARVTRGALIAHVHSFAPPRCRTSQYRRTFVPLTLSLWNDLCDPEFDGVGLVVSRAEPMLPVGMICSFFFDSYCFIFFFLPWVGCMGLGSLD